MFGLLLFVLKTSLILGLALTLTQKIWFSAAVRHLILLVALMSIPLMYLLEGLAVAWLRVEMPEFVQLLILEANNWLLSSSEIDAVSVGALLIAKLKIHSTPLILAYSMGVLVLLCYWFTQIFTTGKRVWDTHLLGGERIIFQLRFGREIKLRQSCIHESPYTWGIFKPIIVVPVDWLFWTEEKQHSVLTHEQAHIRRYDTLSSIVSSLLCCMYWYNPLIWMTRRRLLLFAEQACDDQVVNQQTSVLEYAGHLVEIVRSRKLNMVPAMSGNSSLSCRIRALLDDSTNREGLNIVQVVSVVAISIALIVPLGLVNTAALSYSLLPAHPLQNMGPNKSTGEEVALEQLLELKPSQQLESIDTLVRFEPKNIQFQLQKESLTSSLVGAEVWFF